MCVECNSNFQTEGGPAIFLILFPHYDLHPLIEINMNMSQNFYYNIIYNQVLNIN